MDIGFVGNPNIGSTVLNQFRYSDVFQAFAENFGANDRIFIVSSIFGGTGAAGFPILLKNIRGAQAIGRGAVGEVPERAGQVVVGAGAAQRFVEAGDVGGNARLGAGREVARGGRRPCWPGQRQVAQAKAAYVAGSSSKVGKIKQPCVQVAALLRPGLVAASPPGRGVSPGLGWRVGRAAAYV